MLRRHFIVALALLCSASMSLEALGEGTFRIVMRDGSEFIGAVRSFEDGVYGLSLGSGDRTVAASDVRRIEVVRGTNSGDGKARPRTPDTVGPEYQFLIGKSRFVVGRLRSFEDGLYEIETRLGPLRVPVADVTRIDVSWIGSSDIAAETTVASPGPAAIVADGPMRLAGSNIIGETLIPSLLEAYAAADRVLSTLWVSGAPEHERTFVATASDGKKFTARISRRGTASALDALADGSADFGMMSRQMSPQELQRLAAPGSAKVREHVVGVGGVVVLVHSSNPVKTLRLDQIADIFSGRVRDWSEVGGAARRIRVVAPAEGSGIRDVLRARVLGGRAITPLAARISSSTELSGLVGSDPTAIGLTEFAYVRNAAAVAITDECGLTHVPSEFSIQTEEYPLSSRFFLYTKASPSAGAQRFIDFVLGASGQDRVREIGHVSLLPILASHGMPDRAETKVSDQDDRQIMTQLKTFLGSATRLSVTFRFVAGAADLNARGVADLDRLVEYLRSDGRRGRRVALLGFSDRAGTVASNVRLAEKRARFVAQKLKEKGATADRAFGFGPLLPVACGATPGNLATNNRVEVWLF